MIGKLFSALETAFQPHSGDSSGHDEHAMHLAAAVLMVEVTRSDHEVSPAEEAKLIELIRRRFSLDREETEELIGIAHGEVADSVSLHPFTRRLTDALTLEERIHLVELLWELAFADGRIDKYEEHLIRHLAELLYVPHAAFIRAKHRAERTVGA